MGESSSPPRSVGSSGGGGGGGGAYDIRNEVYNRLLKSGNEEVTRNPELLREQLEAHFIRLPSSYGLDINLDSVEDVLLHQKLLIQAKDKRLAYHVRFLEVLHHFIIQHRTANCFSLSASAQANTSYTDAQKWHSPSCFFAFARMLDS
nr:serine/threonine-protein kinase STY46-like [Ipomoea batatas]